MDLKPYMEMWRSQAFTDTHQKRHKEGEAGSESRIWEWYTTWLLQVTRLEVMNPSAAL